MTPPGRIADTPAHEPSLVAEFGAAAFDSAIQRPINGLTQLVGKALQKDLPQLHIVDVSKANSGAETFAQQAGAAVGMLVPFLGTRALVKGGLGSRLGTGYGGAAIEGGITGFAMGSVLTPVENGQPFWQTRLANGITDAGTFSLFNVTGKAVSSVKALGITAETPLLSRIGKGATAGMLSAPLPGFAHAELHSFTHGKGPASGAEIAGDVAGFMLFGGIFGGVGGARARSRFNPEAEGKGQGEINQLSGVTLTPPEQVAPVRETVVPASRLGNADTVVLPKPAEVVDPKLAVDGTRKVETESPSVTGTGEKILKVKKSGYVGEGDEGAVYSNGDGSVTKVYTDVTRSMEGIKSIFEKLNSIGIRTPKILEYGKTEDGRPAMRMEQIGDGDNLRMQLIMGEIQGADMASLNRQYYAYGDALDKAGIRIDWNLKNMRFQDGILYILDPSFLKNEPMHPSTLPMFAGMIGPRR